MVLKVGTVPNDQSGPALEFKVSRFRSYCGAGLSLDFAGCQAQIINALNPGRV